MRSSQTIESEPRCERDRRLRELDYYVERLRESAGVTPRGRVPLEPIAKHLGIEVLYLRMASEGRLRLYNGRAIVEIDPRGSVLRRRFTLAHELGHAYLLHPERELPWSSCRLWHSTEHLCNDFAASLLLPRPWLETRTGEDEQRLQTLLRIATYSGMSLGACNRRLLHTGLWKRGLLRFERADSEWRLRDAPGVPQVVREGIRVSDASASQITRLAGTEGLTIVLRLHLRSEEVRIKADVKIGRQSCIALVPLEKHADHWLPAWSSREPHRVKRASSPRRLIASKLEPRPSALLGAGAIAMPGTLIVGGLERRARITSVKLLATTSPGRVSTERPGRTDMVTTATPAPVTRKTACSGDNIPAPVGLMARQALPATLGIGARTFLGLQPLSPSPHVGPFPPGALF